MTKILSEITLPWRGMIRRRHTPRRTGDYRLYRPCLRWEFGFSCAFCLLHEADIVAAGAEGWGVMAIEHFVPQSNAPELVDDYTNCFYICTLCNSSRGDQANRDPDGKRLLNPCDHAWNELFMAEDDQVRPREEAGGDAAYTCETYDFNDPRKVRARRMRRLLIRQCRSFLNSAGTLSESLLDHAVETGDSEAVEVAQGLAAMRHLATRELLRFKVIPDDHPTACRCGDMAHHTLPIVMES
jgi:hypothetical protein